MKARMLSMREQGVIIMLFTETMLNEYSQPLSFTENEQCKNAIRMVADALQKLGFTDDSQITPLFTDTFSYSLRMHRIYDGRSIKLLVQGSYANNTNVRTNSDVDIAVIQEEPFRTQYRISGGTNSQSDADYGFTLAEKPTKGFKDEVQDCLIQTFGRDVERKNKSIKIHGNSYRKDADTVPCIRHRDYRNDYSKDVNNYAGGIMIFPDSGGYIINYPEQHIKNGREKNYATNHYYKKNVRIMKKMRYLMEASSCSEYVKAAKNVSSFMLESLLWNINDSWYLDNCEIYRKVYVFYKLIVHCQELKSSFLSFKEANGIKDLCPRQEDFESLCTFIDQLSVFYRYE